MPSPIAHLTAGYVIYRITRRHEPTPPIKGVGPLPGLLLVTAGFSLLPDVDSVVGLLTGDFGRYHNNATHSMLVGTAVSLLFGAGMKRWREDGFRFWTAVALACYGLHVLMDAATWGRGVMALWPLTDSRFRFPFILFYGLHWSQGWLSIRHVWTLFTELLFVLGTVLVFSLSLNRRLLRKSEG